MSANGPLDPMPPSSPAACRPATTGRRSGRSTRRRWSPRRPSSAPSTTPAGRRRPLPTTAAVAADSRSATTAPSSCTTSPLQLHRFHTAPRLLFSVPDDFHADWPALAGIVTW